MRVELLYWDGCPSHPQALRELRAVMSDLGLDPEAVDIREVDTEDAADSERFTSLASLKPKDSIYRRRLSRSMPDQARFWLEIAGGCRSRMPAKTSSLCKAAYTTCRSFLRISTKYLPMRHAY